MITIKDYVEGLFNDIPDSKEKDDIKNEIVLNLEEKVQDLVESGKDEEDAINKSIVELGDISEIKMNLQGAASPTKTDYRGKGVNYSNRLWFSIWGALLIIAFMFFINYTTSWGYPWFAYPTFAILWWPLSMFFSWLNHRSK